MKDSIFRFFTRSTLKRLATKRAILIEGLRGLDLTIAIQPEEVGLDPSVSFRSSASGNKYLKRLLKDLKITKEDAIIDVGCGKGSAMRIMLGFPFARVDGIELSKSIAAIAESNLKKLEVMNSKVFNCDASSFVEYDTYNMVYFYNPFSCNIMSQVIKNILASIERSEREVIIIYNNPVCDDVLVRQDGFVKRRNYPDEWGNGISVYSNRKGAHSRIAR